MQNVFCKQIGLQLLCAARPRLWNSPQVYKPGISAILLQQSRGFNRKKTKKVPPTKPLSFANSGDLKQEPEALDLSQPRIGFEDCEELKNASDTVQKLFSVEFADGRTRQLKRIAEIQEKLGDAPNPPGQLEFRIAMKTAAIRNAIQHCLLFRKDKRAKVRLLETIQARNKDVNKLRVLDLDNFKFVTEKLELEHKPFVEFNFKLSRAATRKKEARDDALKVYHSRMKILQEKLTVEKEEFYKYKEEEFERIAQELKEMGVSDTSDLPTALKEAGIWPINPVNPRKAKRRYQLLEHKFNIAAGKAKHAESA
eukprot:GHVU01027105.1.p1 GENE.GHVU01027105.1~~GHVU01027105.1.p1  ORF type:complete len:311 (+),score=49.16 GHVU01027105.1:73-1005(+)